MAIHNRPITELHAEITGWKSNIELVREDISIYQQQLKEIVRKNNSEELLKAVEHFQNQFIRQLEVSDELLHDLHATDHELALDAGEGPDSELIEAKDQTALRDRANTYDKLFIELKNEYHLFLEKWM
ncbi:MAG: hypothetical protein ABI472_03125 [Ginsengibacter sp.]